MSTEPAQVPVIVVAFPENPHADIEPNYVAEHIKRVLDKQVLPMVALLPDATTEPPSLLDNPHNQEWYSIIRNTGGLNSVIFRANAVDILKAHSNLLVVAVIEFDGRYNLAWDLPQMQQ